MRVQFKTFELLILAERALTDLNKERKDVYERDIDHLMQLTTFWGNKPVFKTREEAYQYSKQDHSGWGTIYDSCFLHWKKNQGDILENLISVCGNPEFPKNVELGNEELIALGFIKE